MWNSLLEQFGFNGVVIIILIITIICLLIYIKVIKSKNKKKKEMLLEDFNKISQEAKEDVTKHKQDIYSMKSFIIANGNYSLFNQTKGRINEILSSTTMEDSEKENIIQGIIRRQLETNENTINTYDTSESESHQNEKKDDDKTEEPH